MGTLISRCVGDTLNLTHERRVMSEFDTQNGPIISVAIGPRTDGDHERLQRALSVLAGEDSSIRVKTESVHGQTILSGMSHEHLEVICNRILHEYEIPIDVGWPTVIYLETIRKPAEGEGKYIRQTGGLGNYGHWKEMRRQNT